MYYNCNLAAETCNLFLSEIKKVGVGLRSIDDPFFVNSFERCNFLRRTGFRAGDEEYSYHNSLEKFRCNIVGCKEEFQTVLDYEIHYNGSHRYVCQNCKKTLPTPRILDIHIQELHDSYFQLMAEKQPMHQCYVAECNLKFINKEDRRSHCISVHKFPKYFRYDKVFKDKPILKEEEIMETDQPEKVHNSTKNKKYPSMKQKHQKGFAKFKVSETVSPKEVNSVNVCSNSTNVGDKSSLKFLPRQIQLKSFNKIVKKGNENTEKNVLESDSIMDIADALSDIN